MYVFTEIEYNITITCTYINSEIHSKIISSESFCISTVWSIRQVQRFRQRPVDKQGGGVGFLGFYEKKIIPLWFSAKK